MSLLDQPSRDIPVAAQGGRYVLREIRDPRGRGRLRIDLIAGKAETTV